MMASPQNYWNWGQNEEIKMNNLHLMPTGSPLLRRRDDDGSSSPSIGLRMKPKMKKTGLPNSPINSPRTQKRIEEDKLAKRIRESYACLRHRAMHKRCPAECPDRRIPKPLPVAMERKEVQQQQQLREHIQTKFTPKGGLSSGTDSPHSSSPNTLRVLQAFQNARISSPIAPRNTMNESNVEYNFNGSPLMMNPNADSSSWDSPWDSTPDLSWNNSMNPQDSPLMETKEDWDSAISSNNWDTKSSSEEEVSASTHREVDYWLDTNSISMIPNSNGNTWNDQVGSLTIDLGNQLDPQTIQLFNELPMTQVDSSPEDTNSNIANLFKILLTRDTLERWIYDDYFNKSLRGFYVRVRIAEMNGVPIFKIGCIVEARDHCFETYIVGQKETQKGLIVHFGSYGQHLVSINSPSNDPPNDQECEEWIDDAEKNHITITSREVEEKIRVASMLNANHSPYSSH